MEEEIIILLNIIINLKFIKFIILYYIILYWIWKKETKLKGGKKNVGKFVPFPLFVFHPCLGEC